MATLCTSTCARSTVNSSGRLWPVRITASLTVEPRGPRMRAMAASRSAPTGMPSMAEIMSPLWIPAVGGRRITERSHHAQRAIRSRHFDADARVGSGRAHAQVGVFLGIEIRRIGVEPADQAAQCIVDELGVGDGVDVFALHAIEDFRELRGFGGRERRSGFGSSFRPLASFAGRRRDVRRRRRRGRSESRATPLTPRASWA